MLMMLMMRMCEKFQHRALQMWSDQHPSLCGGGINTLDLRRCNARSVRVLLKQISGD